MAFSDLLHYRQGEVPPRFPFMARHVAPVVSRQPQQIAVLALCQRKRTHKAGPEGASCTVTDQGRGWRMQRPCCAGTSGNNSVGLG